ncbi:ammonium transporter [Luteolibacter algae]|uniref:Ammonium transporter n=1 Tax=Luteolibacter algae TaxID=454151 RepID=A0ABW5D6T5_9BACT
MTRRHPTTLRALALAAAACFAIPLMPATSHGQEETSPAPTEQVVDAEVTTEAPPAEAAEEAPAYASYEDFMAGPDAAMFTVNNLWILISAALVFIMHLGFCSVESGMCQKKNTVNILFKNVFIVAVGALGYMAWGFNAMYPGDWAIDGWFAMGSSLGNGFADEAGRVAGVTSEYNPGYTIWADFIFQAMFAATAATIVSGAVAERVKLTSFMVYAAILVTILYPITGSWKWGTGWLDRMGFADFAGSTLVHAFGGFAALAAILILGPRRGKFTKDGVKPILPHNLPLANIGVFMLFLGWFGFNGGSVLSADPESVSRVFVTTAMSGFAGGLAAIFASWILLKKPDLSMALNGILAGLVGITAGADVISPWASVLVGLISGALVVCSVLFFDKIKIDDPVGAVSVHGVCGIFGTLAVAIFGTGSFMPQLIGTVSISIFAFVTSFILFYIIKVVMGVRVSAQEEQEGLDVAEHGSPAYSDGH